VNKMYINKCNPNVPEERFGENCKTQNETSVVWNFQFLLWVCTCRCVCVCVSIFTYILTLCFGRGTFQKYLYVFHMHITLSISKSVQDPFKWVEHKHCIYVQKKL
jgi:hypothetical protein